MHGVEIVKDVMPMIGLNAIGVEDATLLQVTDEPIMTTFGLLRHA